MGRKIWRGASQKEYVFATYDVLLPPDLASIARFYMGKPVIYALVSYKTMVQLTPQPTLLHFGAAADGYRRLTLEHQTLADNALLHQCDEIHIMLAPENEGQRSQIMADLLAAHPTLQGHAQQSFKISNSETLHLQFTTASGY